MHFHKEIDRIRAKEKVTSKIYVLSYFSINVSF